MTADAADALHPPVQQRSRASLERVLEAGMSVLEEQGYEGFTLAEVSRRAGVSIGSIYARLPSKEALLRAIHERAMNTMGAERSAATWDPPDELSTSEVIAAAVHRVVDPLRRHSRGLRVFMHRAAVDEVVARRGAAATHRSSDDFKRHVLSRRAEFTHPDPELAADVAFRFVFSTMARQVMYGPTFESQRAIEWEGLVDELGHACASYLLGSLQN